MNNSGILFFEMIDVGSALGHWGRNAIGFSLQKVGGRAMGRIMVMGELQIEPCLEQVTNLNPCGSWRRPGAGTQHLPVPVSCCLSCRSIQKKFIPLQAVQFHILLPTPKILENVFRHLLTTSARALPWAF